MVYYIVTMATIVHSLIVKGLLWVLWNASLCAAYQKSVDIDEPCTVGHQYLLGYDDTLYIGADGNKFFTGSCAISLRAYDKTRKCSKICFTVDSFKLNTCDLWLSFYNSGVWNFGTAKPDFKGDCHHAARGDWCTIGDTATVRLENKKGNWAKMVGKYEFQMVAIARCSEEKTEEPESDWIDGGERFGLNRTVIVAVVLGCVILCLLVVVAVMCVLYRRRPRQYHAASNSNHHALHSPEVSYQDHPVQESCGIPVMDFQDNDSLKYVKDVEAPIQQAPEPSAPPIDDCFMDLRPPSYCGAPPGYNGKANNPDCNTKANEESVTVKVNDGEEKEEEDDDEEKEEDHMI